MTKRLSPHDASRYLREQYGLSRTIRTLANLRSKGGGPAYIRISPKEVVYSQDALDEWAESKIGATFANTAQEVAA
jgi:predicted DNA-binding transcriptional regulator AlpA